MDSVDDVFTRAFEEPVDIARRKMWSYVSENADGWEKTAEHAWRFKNSAWQFKNSDMLEITKPLRQMVILNFMTSTLRSLTLYSTAI